MNIDRSVVVVGDILQLDLLCCCLANKVASYLVGKENELTEFKGV